MSQPTYKIGQLVELKSGGPVMTVSEPKTYDYQVACQWFSGRKLESGQFPPESLKPAEAKPE